MEYSNLGLDKTIFHALLESNLPPQEKLHSRIWQEGQVVIGAGADTTSTTLMIIHFFLLDNPDILGKLRKELEDAMPEKFAPPELSTLEKLPYLVCDIVCGIDMGILLTVAILDCHYQRRFKGGYNSHKLSFKLTIPRLSYGVSSRLQRLHPTGVMKFHEWEIPPGVNYLLISIYSMIANPL